MHKNISVQPDGVYNLKFSWKDNHPSFPLNYAVCTRYARFMACQLRSQDTKTPVNILHNH